VRKIQLDEVSYNEGILGKKPSEYIKWICQPKSWGGSVELSIFSEEYKCEIVVRNFVAIFFWRGFEVRRYSGISFFARFSLLGLFDRFSLAAFIFGVPKVSNNFFLDASLFEAFFFEEMMV
jgi:hypothetical protein